MVRQRRHKTYLRAAWVAAFAMMFQALMPVLHHPAGMAIAGALSPDATKNICIAAAPGTITPGDHDKSPAPASRDCALCQAIHAIGGFVPPVAPVIAAAPTRDVSPIIPTAISVPLRRSYAAAQPRAPPTPV
jgi:hypothetical protein